jgi:L,D-transpeptidase ErfK/SrfK
MLYTQYSIASTYVTSLSKDLIGDVKLVNTNYSTNLLIIAEQYSVGMSQLIAANPTISDDVAIPAGTTLNIPTAFILPPGRHQGIIINLPEMRLYYFPDDNNLIKTYPVGIGKIGQTIPLTNTVVTKKIINPIWTPTANIRAYNLEKNIKLPAFVPPGPNNPLGEYAIYLAIPEYRIHATFYSDSIGRRASFGCIRMRTEDIKDFFNLLEINTPVQIINEPSKIGWLNNKLYLEVHEPLSEMPTVTSTDKGVVELIQEFTANKPALINWELVKFLLTEHDGMPHEIGVAIETNMIKN